MDTVIITLRRQQGNIDLALPTGVPLAQLAPILVSKLSLDDLTAADDTVLAARVTTSGLMVQPEQTMATAGVVDGDILEIVTAPKSEPSISAAVVSSSRPQLRCMVTGRTFTLRGRTALVGRGRNTAVNLSSLPHSDAVSRKHARITHRANEFWLRDEHSKNGTLVNGTMLSAGKEERIHNGSHLQFGVDGPTLVFYSGNS